MLSYFGYSVGGGCVIFTMKSRRRHQLLFTFLLFLSQEIGIFFPPLLLYSLADWISKMGSFVLLSYLVSSQTLLLNWMEFGSLSFLMSWVFFLAYYYILQLGLLVLWWIFLGCFWFLVTLKCIDCSQLEHSVLFVSPTMIAHCL